MVYDVVGLEYEMDHDEEMDDSPSVDETPNIEAQKFYELLDAAQKPLWPGSSTIYWVSNLILYFVNNFNVYRNVYNYRHFVQYLEASIPNISRIDIDGRIASEFPFWFRTYVSIVHYFPY